MSNTTTTVRMDDVLKSQVNSILEGLGLSFNTFVIMASKQLVYENGLPFEAKIPKEINPVLRKLMVEEEAIQLGLIPDDSIEIQDDFFDGKMEQMQTPVSSF